MNLYHIAPSHLVGSVVLPASKSHTLRALFFSMMAKGRSRLHHYLPSPDTMAMIEAIKNLGAQVIMDDHTITIEGVGSSLHCAEDVIQAGNSGIVFRFLTALAALMPTYTIITGDRSIRHSRPIEPLLQALTELGVFTASSRLDGHAPVIIRGPMRGGKTCLEGKDSQLVSALLFAGAFASDPIEIEVHHPGETPWIDLSLDWLKRLKIPYEHQNYSFYRVPGRSIISPFEYEVPGDLSAAAYPIVGALITHSEMTLHAVDLRDIQGDKALIPLLEEMGACFEINTQQHTLKVLKYEKLVGKSIDVNKFIDALPILAVLGCFAEGVTELYNAEIARHKECDRISCIVKELKKMGADIEEKRDGMMIRTSALRGANVDTYHDHRMVLALSIAAMGAQGDTCVHNVEAVQKSYPSFLQDMQQLGAGIQQCV